MACLTHAGSGTYSQQVPNTDDLAEYYEYHTGVPSRWANSDTVWLHSVEAAEGDAPRVLELEPPLQVTLEVPSEHTPSISGLSYAGKKLVVQFSEGIDVYNSPGFPLWCLNKYGRRRRRSNTEAARFLSFPKGLTSSSQPLIPLPLTAAAPGQQGDRRAQAADLRRGRLPALRRLEQHRPRNLRLPERLVRPVSRRQP